MKTNCMVVSSDEILEVASRQFNVAIKEGGIVEDGFRMNTWNAKEERFGDWKTLSLDEVAAMFVCNHAEVVMSTRNWHEVKALLLWKE